MRSRNSTFPGQMPHSFSCSFASDFRLRSLAIYGSVNSKRTPPSPRAFVFFFFGTAESVLRWGPGGFIQKPHVRALKKCVQMPHAGTTLKLHFPVNKLQMPYLTVQY